MSAASVWRAGHTGIELNAEAKDMGLTEHSGIVRTNIQVYRNQTDI